MADPDSPALLAVRLGDLLTARGEHLVVAEGATGGALANLLTDVPGSSAWFRAGVVAYTDYPKQLLLRVSTDTLIDQGTISAEATAQMARLARRLFTAHWALAVTGYADDRTPAVDERAQGVPGKRPPESEVIPDEKRSPTAGLTFLALSARSDDGDQTSWEERWLSAPDRATYKQEASAAAIELLLAAIES